MRQTREDLQSEMRQTREETVELYALSRRTPVGRDADNRFSTIIPFFPVSPKTAFLLEMTYFFTRLSKYCP